MSVVDFKQGDERYVEVRLTNGWKVTVHEYVELGWTKITLESEKGAEDFCWISPESVGAMRMRIVKPLSVL